METKKMTIDEQMELWKQRSKDEFGTIIKKIEDACSDYFVPEEDEYGIKSTPLTYYITAYSVDGYRGYVARSIHRILENHDLLDNPKIKKLDKEMMKLATENA